MPLSGAYTRQTMVQSFYMAHTCAMAIHWYPGHMHKAIREMNKILADADLVIELLDARLPFSSQNPVIEKLRQNKPSIKILSKSDLADRATTSLWQPHFEPLPISKFQTQHRRLLPFQSFIRCSSILAIFTSIQHHPSVFQQPGYHRMIIWNP